MITVCFYGDLRRYGRRFDLQAESPAEALHALFTQIKGLRQHIRNGVYQVRWRGKDQSSESIQNTFTESGAGILHIVPRVAGAGKRGGVIQTVLGVVLIVVGAFTSWSGGGYLIQAGIGLLLGGVAQMLTKMPKMETGKGIDASKNTAFSNLSNTVAQGNPVPLAYGLCYCGSRVVSQGIESRRIETGTDGNSQTTGNSIVRMVAAAAGVTSTGEDPLAVDLSLGMAKTFTAGVAATAPNGQKYDTDFANDSVRAKNYTATYKINQ